MWAGILAGFRFLAGLVDVVRSWRRSKDREEQREAGRNEQKVAQHESDRKQARKAHKAGRSDNADLDDIVRDKYS